MQRRRFVSSLAAGAAVPAGAQFRPHEAQGLRLSVTCDMFRGPDVRLPFDNPGRTDPRPQPVRKYEPEQALALTHASGYQGFEMFDWRDPAERAAYRAAQSRDWDAVIAVTDQLNEACANCHEVYRDVGAEGRGVGADRCRQEP